MILKYWIKKFSFVNNIRLKLGERGVTKRTGFVSLLHIANKKFNPTKGCIAIRKKDGSQVLT